MSDETAPPEKHHHSLRERDAAEVRAAIHPHGLAENEVVDGDEDEPSAEAAKDKPAGS